MLYKILHTILGMAGIVLEHTTFARALSIIASIGFTLILLPQYQQLSFAIGYFVISSILYIGFIFIVLRPKGIKLQLIQKFGEEKAYRYYEGFLAFAFFHNGASISFISESTAGTGYWEHLPTEVVVIFALGIFAFGMITKIWAAYLVGIPIYYWKDLFLERKISDFVMSGPYLYFKNPMYGVGQLPVYAMAIYYNSIYGLIFGAINQALVFTFYFLVEKPFIKRTYLQ